MIERSSLPDNGEGPVALVGEFDGFHRGHQRVARAAVALGERAQRPTVAVVFDAEAREVVLTDPAARTRRLLAAGISRASVLEVPAHGVEAPTLCESIQASVRPVAVVLSCPPHGTDQPAYPQLAAAFRAGGVEVFEVDRETVDGSVVTSAEVRRLVESGRVARANRLLGGAYTMWGTVSPGNRLGRTIGFPTANLFPPERRVLPAHGVYAGRVRVGSQLHAAAINVGVRPTVERAGTTLVEAHLLDFDDDLYGTAIAVDFVERIRDERRFDNLDALMAQLQRDVEQVRRLDPVASASGHGEPDRRP